MHYHLLPSILIAVLKIPSAAEEHKAFSKMELPPHYGDSFMEALFTFSSYLCSATLTRTRWQQLATQFVLHAKPFSYSLRNKGMKQGLMKLKGKRKSQQPLIGESLGVSLLP